MKTYLVDKTENTVTVAFKDANLTLITPLMKALYDDEDVELVRYIDKHPELEDRQLFVQVKKGDPIAAISKASDAVADYYSCIKEGIPCTEGARRLRPVSGCTTTCATPMGPADI